MKKIIILAIAIVVVFVFVGCTGKKETSAPSGEVTASGQVLATEQEQPLRLEDIDLAKLFERENHFVGGLGDNFQKYKLSF